MAAPALSAQEWQARAPSRCLYVSYAPDSTVRLSIAETALLRLSGDSAASLRAERVENASDTSTYFLILSTSPLAAADPLIHRPVWSLAHPQKPFAYWWVEQDSTIIRSQGTGWTLRLALTPDSLAPHGHFSESSHLGLRSEGRAWARTQACP